MQERIEINHRANNGLPSLEMFVLSVICFYIFGARSLRSSPAAIQWTVAVFDCICTGERKKEVYTSGGGLARPNCINDECH